MVKLLEDVRRRWLGASIVSFVLFGLVLLVSTVCKISALNSRELWMNETYSVFVASLPRNRSGKIMRRVLRARFLGQDEGDLSSMETWHPGDIGDRRERV